MDGNTLQKAKDFADETINDPLVETGWALKAAHHAEVYDKIVSTMKDCSVLKLTRVDDQIYSSFRSSFPELKVDVVSESDLKSESAKELWRPFLMNFKDLVEDFNFATLLRIDLSNPALNTTP
eukprot:TRINITY_DN3714_c0_g1_i2.p1 TRINITY_DN3714_c0_g1~~TRINITY_DN3714_c0_g1_i2.p1  ORF type:complete len:142 (-),score=36.38 TRINITY_DN3714_c0_g1_i2:323-691(-)